MLTFKLIDNSDIETITFMMEEFYAIDHYPIDIALTKELFKEFISDKNLGMAWLIVNEKEILGYVILTFIFSFEYKGKIAFLDELYIKEKMRGKGVGNQTIEFIKQQVTLLKVKLIYLEVETHNENAQKLYLANDFEFHNRKLMKYKIKE